MPKNEMSDGGSEIRNITRSFLVTGVVFVVPGPAWSLVMLAAKFKLVADPEGVAILLSRTWIAGILFMLLPAFTISFLSLSARMRTGEFLVWKRVILVGLRRYLPILVGFIVQFILGFQRSAMAFSYLQTLFGILVTGYALWLLKQDRMSVV
ncbi:MAG: hypothetical protein ABII00_18345 [Elusimicrobiota bacterium]